MVDSDDTDELLLIPPDYLTKAPPGDTLTPYFDVVDHLISQVTELEHRINTIETTSELSFVTEEFVMNLPQTKQLSSAHSTPQKPRTRFTARSLPNTPELSRLKPGAKEPSPVLGEIDEFLTHVKMIKRLNASRSLENDFGEIERPFRQKKVWQDGDNIQSVPDYGFGMRDQMHPSLETTTSEDTQSTAFDKLSFRTKVVDGANDLGLLSLANLWGATGANDNFQQKLQEERLRRQHCERAIQELQHRILELQERVSVAIQVDEAKDKAILQFHESWEKTGVKLQELQKEKQSLTDEVQKLVKKMSEGNEETSQRVIYYENEAIKALDLANTSQEKMGELEKKYSSLKADFKIIEANSEEFQKKYLLEIEKNKQFPEILARKELELNECKTILAEARTEVSQSKKAIEMCQTELVSLQKENEEMQRKLDSELENNRVLTQQKVKIVEEITAHKNVSRGLESELGKARDQLETTKIELKNFYQGQVELVVQNKLKEFQKQLDEAEKKFKNEVVKKEMNILKNAANHVQQISEKHVQEVKLLEEKHEENCRLYQIQIAQYRQELEEANVRVKRQSDKQQHIERQLHKFMETLRQDHVTTLDEMNSFRSRSFNNLEEILAQADKEKITETPISSKHDRRRKEKESTIQEKIQMLLEKKENSEEKDLYSKLLKGMKPPWK